MNSLSVADAVGFGAGFLVLTTFYLKTMVPLRTVAICSNLAFISYGLITGAVPILMLHALLLPLNAVRLIQMKKLIQRIVRASRGGLTMDMLVPYMGVRHVAAGTTLFARGDPAETVFYILNGRVRVVGRNTVLKTGAILGEMGIFSTDQKRTDTVVCETDVELASITEDKIWELFYQNPEFGAYLLRIIVQRATEPPVVTPEVGSFEAVRA